MGRRLLTTPRSRVRAMLSQIFLRSRERAAAVKRESGCCQRCKAKGRPKATRNGPQVSLQVHHLDGGGIDEIMDLIFTRLLCSPDRLKVLCAPCHDAHEHIPGPLACPQRRSLP